jgi:hypothetical protein
MPSAIYDPYHKNRVILIRPEQEDVVGDLEITPTGRTVQ